MGPLSHGQVGAGGKHKWTIRASPRGIVQVSPDLAIGCAGQYHNNCGVNAEDYYKQVRHLAPPPSLLA